MAALKQNQRNSTALRQVGIAVMPCNKVDLSGRCSSSVKTTEWQKKRKFVCVYSVVVSSVPIAAQRQLFSAAMELCVSLQVEED